MLTLHHIAWLTGPSCTLLTCGGQAERCPLHTTAQACDVLLCVLFCVSCRFYETDSAIKIGMMEAFKKLAVDPESLPDIIIASIGRTTWKVGAATMTATTAAAWQTHACVVGVSRTHTCCRGLGAAG